MPRFKKPREILIELAKKKFEEDGLTRSDIKEMTGYFTETQKRYFHRTMDYFEEREKPQKDEGWKK